MKKQTATTSAIPEDVADSLRRAYEALEEIVQVAQQHVDDQLAQAITSQDVDEQQRLDNAAPQRWLDEGRHSLQAGMMFLSRAIQQPITF
jgi:hypothetical protein